MILAFRHHSFKILCLFLSCHSFIFRLLYTYTVFAGTIVLFYCTGRAVFYCIHLVHIYTFIYMYVLLLLYFTCPKIFYCIHLVPVCMNVFECVLFVCVCVCLYFYLTSAVSGLHTCG